MPRRIVRLTRFGIKAAVFYTAIVTTYFAAPYSNLFFLLLAFLTLQWIVCAVGTHRNFAGISAELRQPEPVPAGAAAAVRARIVAPGRARFGIVVELELADGTRASAQVAVVDGEAELAVPLGTLPRGVHALRRATVSSTFPFGLLVARRTLAADVDVVVFPRPAELVDARSRAEALAEMLGERASGPGVLQPAGLRDHRTGEELRGVHWRASARRGSLVVREWEGGGGEGLEVVIDRRCDEATLERALAVASAMVALARENKELLAIASQGLDATYGDGHEPWARALRFLAGAGALDAQGPPPPPKSPGVTRLPQALLAATGGRA